MASLGDTVVTGIDDYAPEARVNVVRQAMSSSFYKTLSPGGAMAEAILLLPANPRRSDIRMVTTVSGSAVLRVCFVPNQPLGLFSFSVANSSVVSSTTFMPAGYTGPIYGYWNGIVAASGAAAYFYEYTY